LAAGDRETAAAAEIEHGELRWFRGNRDDAFSHFDRAVSLVVDRPPSLQKAFVTSSVSRFLMLAGRAEEAIRIGGEALAMAEDLGLSELRAHALNNIGVAKLTSGDVSGLDDLRRSIDIASERNSPEMLRGVQNLGSTTFQLGEIPRAEELHREGIAISERFGITGELHWMRAEIALDAYYLGRWDEATPALDALIAESGEGARQYMEAPCRDVRSRMRLARGDIGGAIGDASTMLELAAGIKDPQVLYPSRAVAARVFLAADRVDDALSQVDTLLAEIGTEGIQDFAGFWSLQLAVVMEALGRGPEFLARASTLGAPTPWLEAATLWADGELSRAADLLGDIRSLPDEALARLRAADQLVAAGRRAEADEQLGRALAFFRSVGASRYIREGEALLAASA
jgi:tetratricopeptide (TPR) repeat protein